MASTAVVGLGAERPVVALLVGADGARGELERRIASFAHVLACATTDELLGYTRARAPQAVLAEVNDVNGASVLFALKDVSQRFPQCAILLLVGVSEAGVRQMFQICSHVRVGAVVVRGTEDEAVAVRRAVEGFGQTAPDTAILAALRPEAPLEVRRFVEFCAVQCKGPIRAKEAATALSLPLRTLQRRMHDAALPSPHRMIAWCRIVFVVWHAAVLGMPMKGVAATLGFPSPASLYTLFHRYLRMAPRAVIAAGGVEFLLATLRRQSFHEHGPVRSPPGKLRIARSIDSA